MKFKALAVASSLVWSLAAATSSRARDHRADSREGERRDLHEERPRAAPGCGAAPEGPGDRPQERPEQRAAAQGARRGHAADHGRSGRRNGHRPARQRARLQAERRAVQERRRQHPQGKQDRERRAVPGRAQVREHDDGGPAPEPRAADDLSSASSRTKCSARSASPTTRRESTTNRT